MNRGKTVRDADRDPIRFLGTIQDVTKIKQVEKPLRESEAANRAMLEAFPDMIFLQYFVKW
jgi:PAS domain-containing protein